MREVDYIRAQLLAKLGEGSVASKKYQEAVNYIKEFFELKLKNSFHDLAHLENPCYFNRGFAYLELGDYEKAISDLSTFISKDTSNFDAYFLRLQAYFELDLLDEAIADMKSALILMPSRGDLFINMGIAYLKKGDTENAEKSFQQAVELGFSDAKTYIDEYC